MPHKSSSPTPLPQDTVLRIDIEHSKPVEMKDFVSSLNALNGLYSAYVRQNADNAEVSTSKLYVEKVQEGSIIIILCEFVAANILPLMENANIILEFAGYLKKAYSYFARGEGSKPALNRQECAGLRKALDVVASDYKGKITISAVDRVNTMNVHNNFFLNFGEVNGAQNQLQKEEEELAAIEPKDDIHSRVLMQIYQVRNEAELNKGNKAIIDEIFKGKKVSVLFETDELKNDILFLEENPTQKAFQVDVKVQTVNEKVVAYKVIALHDVVDIPED